MFDACPCFALQGDDGQSWPLHSEQLVLQAVNDVRKLRLQARPGAEVNPVPLESLIGGVLPSDPLDTTEQESSIYWLAPNDWLLLNPKTDIGNIRNALQASSNGTTSLVTDVTDAYAIIDISGRDAAAKLAEGCSVDLDDKVFPSGRYVLTRLQHLSVIIHRLDNTPRFRVLADRSVVRFLRDWLVLRASCDTVVNR